MADSVTRNSNSVEVGEKRNAGLAQLPSLEDFLATLAREDSQLASVESGYNVYNKYNKTS